MADTGLINPTTQTAQINGANAIDDDDDTFASHISIGGTAITMTFGSFNGTDPSAGSTINGIEVFIRAAENTFWQNVAYVVEIALDGVSGTYSSTTDTIDIDGTTTNYTLGSSTDLWGLDWSGWTDLSDLAVKIVADNYGGSTGGHASSLNEVRAKVYYTEGVTVVKNGKISLTSGKLTLSSGKISL
tara:strand:- start:54 stop:614 length:561 start_codon:yes stop_codon:yes gene_type:complete